jgi:hypothetical protein
LIFIFCPAFLPGIGLVASRPGVRIVVALLGGLFLFKAFQRFLDILNPEPYCAPNSQVRQPALSQEAIDGPQSKPEKRRYFVPGK